MVLNIIGIVIIDSIINEIKLKEENICSIKSSLNILYTYNWSKHVNEEAVIKQAKLRAWQVKNLCFLS